MIKLPWTGIGAAAAAASSIRQSYPNIVTAFVVGVCAGAPKNGKDDIILGDILISTQVIQHDHGRMLEHGLEHYRDIGNALGRASREISSFVGTYRTTYERKEMERLVRESVNNLLEKDFLQGHAYPGREKDWLFPSGYPHQHLHAAECDECRNDPGTCQQARQAPKQYCTALGCDPANLIRRERLELSAFAMSSQLPSAPPRSPVLSAFFTFTSTNASAAFPTIAAYSLRQVCFPATRLSDRVPIAKNSSNRTALSASRWRELVSGTTFRQWLSKVSRDYADSHKNKEFQRYAAVTAAACAKVLLQRWHFVDSSPVPQGIVKLSCAYSSTIVLLSTSPLPSA